MSNTSIVPQLIQSQYERRKEYIKAYQKKKYAENAEYREHQKAIVNSNGRIKYKTNDEYKQKQTTNAVKNIKKNREYIKQLEEELKTLRDAKSPICP